MYRMEERRQLPDSDQLSVLAALILFVYVLSPFIDIPARAWEVRSQYAVFDFVLNPSLLISLLAATIAAIGADWILRRHPRLETNHTLQHQLIPSFTAWVLGIPLTNLPINWRWWLIFILGGVLMVFIFIAEYIVVDYSDVRHTLATIGLTAISFALFMFLVISIRSMAFRLYMLLPIVGAAIFLMTWRTFYLKYGSRWSSSWCIAVSLIVCQVGAGLHYLPLSSVAYGVILTGVAYALTSLAGSLIEGMTWGTAWIEPTIVIIFMICGVFLIAG